MLDSFVYQYAVGGAVFAAGIACGFATGQLGLRGTERRRLLLLCAGLLFFFALQGALVVFGK